MFRYYNNFQEKEAATEMLKLSQMTLNNLEEVLDEQRKSCSTDYIKTVSILYLILY